MFNPSLRMRPFILTTILLLIMASPGLAHQLGEGYVIISVLEGKIQGRLEMSLGDLDKAVHVDGDHDGKISETELDNRIDDVWDYANSRFTIRAGGVALQIKPASHQIVRVPLGQYVQLHFEADTQDQTPKTLEFWYSLLFDVDAQHRGFLIVEYNHKTGVTNNLEAVSLIFSPGNETQSLDTTVKPSSSRTLAAFIGHGIWHIWIGIDHILFLVALVLPAVLLRSDRQWQPVPSFKPALIRVIKIVTVFTVAHSITLCLAAIGVISLSSRWVESIIAFSVLLAAINNIYPFFKDWTWIIIFAFGLFHGMGFASVLGNLIEVKGSMLNALVGFNVGVEIGQIAIVVAVFPLLYLARQLKAYLRVVLQGGSAIIAFVALVWCIERLFDLESVLVII